MGPGDSGVSPSVATPGAAARPTVTRDSDSGHNGADPGDPNAGDPNRIGADTPAEPGVADLARDAVAFGRAWLNLVAGEVAGFVGGDAALGVHPLDVRHAVKNARPFAGDHLEAQPGDRVGVREGAFLDRADDLAAAVALPGGSCVVRADDAISAGIRVEHRLGSDEDPAHSVPAVDLHALGKHVRRDFVSGRYSQLLPFAQVRATLIIAGQYRGNQGKQEQNEGRSRQLERVSAQRGRLLWWIHGKPSFRR